MEKADTVRNILVSNGIDITKLVIRRKGSIKYLDYNDQYIGISFVSSISNQDYLARVDNATAHLIIDKIAELNN